MRAWTQLESEQQHHQRLPMSALVGKLSAVISELLHCRDTDDSACEAMMYAGVRRTLRDPSFSHLSFANAKQLTKFVNWVQLDQIADDMAVQFPVSPAELAQYVG